MKVIFIHCSYKSLYCAISSSIMQPVIMCSIYQPSHRFRCKIYLQWSWVLFQFLCLHHYCLGKQWKACETRGVWSRQELPQRLRIALPWIGIWSLWETFSYETMNLIMSLDHFLPIWTTTFVCTFTKVKIKRVSLK